MPRIALMSGSFDPPARHHRELIEQIGGSFDEVRIVPYGLRPETRTPPDTPSIYRATMTDMTFRGLSNVHVDLSELEENTYSSPARLEAAAGADGGEVWHIVPAELVRGGQDSAICRCWEDGPRMWKKSRFLILRQPAEPLGEELPEHHQVTSVKPYLPAGAIRSKIFHQESIEDWLQPDVAAYIDRHGLYRGLRPTRHTPLTIGRPAFQLCYDPLHPQSEALARALRPYESDRPELIVVLGGDGTMLRAIRTHWRKRIPFYGVNTGHLGFLLNDRQVFDDTAATGFWARPLRIYQLSLLWVEAKTVDAGYKRGYAFNEVWVERQTGQTAWLNLKVNQHERIAKLVCDGLLVSTAAGSTAYARAMGGPSVPFDTSVLLLVGSNVLTPTYWRPSVLPITSEVEIATLDPHKRPLLGYMDGVPLGKVESLRIRVSRISSAELVFQVEHDPVAKLAKLQFPGGD